MPDMQDTIDVCSRERVVTHRHEVLVQTMRARVETLYAMRFSTHLYKKWQMLAWIPRNRDSSYH